MSSGKKVAAGDDIVVDADEHPRHGTAKLPPITACPLEPTPRPFAPLNDRARQRMRAASTLDVTTGLLGALLD